MAAMVREGACGPNNPEHGYLLTGRVERDLSVEAYLGLDSANPVRS